MQFTLDGSGTLERKIADDVAKIGEAVLQELGPENITALVLGGGYGRGEGGVYAVDGEERVYNDYDFFVVVPFSSRRRRKWVSRRLHGVKNRFEPECGIHVDFSPPMPSAELPRQPRELMMMEAKVGHHVVYGPEDVFDALPEYDVQHPPLEEGARLFMNRGIGLLMAWQLLREKKSLDEIERQFVVRNIYKALMAMGDGVLFIEGNYSPSYAERLDRFDGVDKATIPDIERLRDCYRAALDFKFRPRHDVPLSAALDDWYRDSTEIFLDVFLWFERNRLSMDALTWETYAALPRRLPALSRGARWKNPIRNARRSGASLGTLRECFLHPRDRILKYLPNLLKGSSDTAGEETLVLRLWEHFG